MSAPSRLQLARGSFDSLWYNAPRSVRHKNILDGVFLAFAILFCIVVIIILSSPSFPFWLGISTLIIPIVLMLFYCIVSITQGYYKTRLDAAKVEFTKALLDQQGFDHTYSVFADDNDWCSIYIAAPEGRPAIEEFCLYFNCITWAFSIEADEDTENFTSPIAQEVLNMYASEVAEQFSRDPKIGITVHPSTS